MSACSMMNIIFSTYNIVFKSTLGTYLFLMYRIYRIYENIFLNKRENFNFNRESFVIYDFILDCFYFELQNMITISIISRLLI